jgi:hypothetical protein
VEPFLALACAINSAIVSSLKMDITFSTFSMIGHYGRTRDAHVLTIIKLSPRVKNAESSLWLQALASERQLWD